MSFHHYSRPLLFLPPPDVRSLCSKLRCRSFVPLFNAPFPSPSFPSPSFPSPSSPLTAAALLLVTPRRPV